VNIFILLLCVALRKRQPFRSRGMIPFITLAAQYTSTYSRITTYAFDYQWRSNYQCFVDELFFYTMIQASILLIPVTLFNYILTVNINLLKNSIKSTVNQKNNHYLRFIRVLKFLLSKRHTVVLLISYVLFCWVLYTTVSLYTSQLGKLYYKIRNIKATTTAMYILKC
jgi:hypothetical protein